YEALSCTGCNFPFVYYFYYYFIHRHGDLSLLFLPNSSASFCVVFLASPQPYSVSPNLVPLQARNQPSQDSEFIFVSSSRFPSSWKLVFVPSFSKRRLDPFLSFAILRCPFFDISGLSRPTQARLSTRRP